MFAGIPQVVWFILGAVLVIAAVVMYGPWLAEQWSKNRVITRCENLRAELDELRSSGNGSSQRAAQLQAELTACTQEAQRYGADASVAEVTLQTCDALSGAIETEWMAYKSTPWGDAVQRNNKRQNLLSTGRRLVQCLRQALAEAASEEALMSPEGSAAIYKAIRGAAVVALGNAQGRYNCYKNDGPGCGRYGLNEDHGNDKAIQENEATVVPLRDIIADVDGRIAALRAKANNNQLGAILGTAGLLGGFDFSTMGAA